MLKREEEGGERCRKRVREGGGCTLFGVCESVCKIDTKFERGLKQAVATATATATDYYEQTVGSRGVAGAEAVAGVWVKGSVAVVRPRAQKSSAEKNKKQSRND